MASEGKMVIVQGRIVWTAGDLFKGRVQTIFGTNQPKLDPKTGEETIQFGIGLSVPKAELADPERGKIWAAMHEEARALYPTGQIPPAFAWKYKDGDGIDDQGKPFNVREGYAGCLVFSLTTGLPIRYFRWENGMNVQVSDGIKCGDYVNVQVAVRGQISAKPGLYLNPMAIQLVAPGKEIFNAPNADQIFGMNAPVAPSNYVPPEQPTMPPPPGAPMGPPAAAPPAPPTAPGPNYGVVPPAFQPPTAAGQYPPPAGMPPIPGIPR